MKTLRELIESPGFAVYQESTLGNDLFINDPDRANRIHEAAADGCDGSTHAEHIQDWRDYLASLRVFDPEFDFDYERAPGMIDQVDVDTITEEIDACEAHHEVAGTLHDQCS